MAKSNTSAEAKVKVKTGFKRPVNLKNLILTSIVPFGVGIALLVIVGIFSGLTFFSGQPERVSGRVVRLNLWDGQPAFRDEKEAGTGTNPIGFLQDFDLQKTGLTTDTIGVYKLELDQSPEKDRPQYASDRAVYIFQDPVLEPPVYVPSFLENQLVWYILILLAVVPSIVSIGIFVTSRVRVTMFTASKTVKNLMRGAVTWITVSYPVYKSYGPDSGLFNAPTINEALRSHITTVIRTLNREGIDKGWDAQQFLASVGYELDPDRVLQAFLIRERGLLPESERSSLVYPSALKGGILGAPTIDDKTDDRIESLSQGTLHSQFLNDFLGNLQSSGPEWLNMVIGAALAGISQVTAASTEAAELTPTQEPTNPRDIEEELPDGELEEEAEEVS